MVSIVCYTILSMKDRENLLLIFTAFFELILTTMVAVVALGV